MQSKKINKVRTFLLIQTDHEIKEYLKKSFTYINTKSPKDLATQYDNDYVVNFDNSIANNLNMSNTHPLLVPNRKVNTSNNDGSLLNFTRNFIAQGENFIQNKKIELGSRKLLSYKKNLILNLNDEMSIKSFCKSTKSIKTIKKRSNISSTFLFSKAEKKARLLQENYDYLNALANKFRDGLTDENESESGTFSNKNSIEFFPHNSITSRQMESPNCITPINVVKSITSNSNLGIGFGIQFQTETEVVKSVQTNDENEETSTNNNEISSFFFE